MLYHSLRKHLKMCTNKPLVIVDKGPWYRWTFERLGLEYRHERFGIRNRVERFFRYLKERTIVFHHKLSARNHIQGITNLKQFLNLFSLYYIIRPRGQGGEQKCLFGHYLADLEKFSLLIHCLLVGLGFILRPFPTVVGCCLIFYPYLCLRVLLLGF
jgi:hypothetical protein